MFPCLRPSREQQGGQNKWTPWLFTLGGQHRKAHAGSHFGVLAQLVERLNGIEEVRGSIPLGSIPSKNCRSSARLYPIWKQERVGKLIFL